MSVNPKVYVVDDAAIRTSLQRPLHSADMICEVFDSAQAFLDRPLSQGPICLLLDVNLAQGTGVDLQQTLLGLGQTFPIIFMTGYGTIAMPVRAIKSGARDFLTKPFEPEQLLDLVREALTSDAASIDERCLSAFVNAQEAGSSA